MEFARYSLCRYQAACSRLGTARTLLALVVHLATPGTAKSAGEPQTVQTHFDAAHSFQLAGDLSHAESEYRQMLGLALRQIGNFRANHNDFVGADEVFTTALALQTDDADLHVDYAILHLRRERFPEARREAEAAGNNLPRHAPG